MNGLRVGHILQIFSTKRVRYAELTIMDATGMDDITICLQCKPWLISLMAIARRNDCTY